MADLPIDADERNAGKSKTSRSLTLGSALTIAVLGIAVAAGTTVYLLRTEHGTGADAILAAIALTAFGVAAFGLMQAVLAVVDTAGERRRHDREVSERRKGDRARQPRG